jgi:tRNA C32,U32 (ribose-2'-O)-methylase TrmJ
VRIVGADEDAPLTARQADLRGPLALVVGSEGQGIGPAVRRRLDLAVRIPMRGSIGSLNAAVAGSIVLFEILEQRGDAPPVPGPVTEEVTFAEEASADLAQASPHEAVPAMAAVLALEPSPADEGSQPSELPPVEEAAPAPPEPK